VFGLPRGVGVYGMLCPAHELHVLGGHGDWCLPAPTPGGVQPLGVCQEPPHQGHLEGQSRASSREPCLEARVKKLNDELMRTYHSHDVKLDFLDDARTQLKNTQDELVAAQSYIHHLETGLHERDKQLEAS
jgi:hypothetical protein